MFQPLHNQENPTHWVNAATSELKCTIPLLSSGCAEITVLAPQGQKGIPIPRYLQQPFDFRVIMFRADRMNCFNPRNQLQLISPLVPLNLKWTKCFASHGEERFAILMAGNEETMVSIHYGVCIETRITPGSQSPPIRTNA